MNRHRADLVSLFFGLFFAAVAGWWAMSTYLNVRLDWNVPNLGWIAAGALILIGLLGVVASLRGDRREPAAPEPTPTPTTVDDTASFEPVTVPDALDQPDAFDQPDQVGPPDPVDRPEDPRP